MNEVEVFLDELQTEGKDGASVANVKEKVYMAAVNSIWSTVAGKKTKEDEEHLKVMWSLIFVYAE